MATYFEHIIESSFCIAMFYIIYILFFRRDNGFRFVRYYFLAAMVISLLLPFNTTSLTYGKISAITGNTIYANKNANTSGGPKDLAQPGNTKPPENRVSKSLIKKPDYPNISRWIYFSGFTVVLLVFVTGILKVLRLYFISSKERSGKAIVIMNSKITGSFSFLNLMFINPQGLKKKEIKSVLAHESIHVEQHHTIDLLLVGLLSAVMWFNPFVWMLRNSIRQVHEYLADEGVLNIGFDRLEYQTLLINQVAGSRLFSLASSFNHSQLKSRIIMMTKLTSSNRTKLKLLAILPVTAVLFLTLSCINGQGKTDVITAVEPVRMNVLYIGMDNPVKIAASGYETSELEVSIDNGVISGSSGEYIIRPKEKGDATVKIGSKGKTIQETRFRVKYTPDPVVVIQKSDKINDYVKYGNITKEEMLTAGGLIVLLENIDFDLRFEIVEFTLSSVIDGYYKMAISHSDRFTNEQKAIINNVENKGKILFEDIKVKGPDGTVRQLGTTAFTMSEI